MAIDKITIAAARKNIGITQEKLAALCGVSAKTVGNWEAYKTEPTVSQAKKIASAVNLDIDDICFLPRNTVKP